MKHKKPPWIEDPSLLDLPSAQVLRPVDPGYENVDRLAKSIASEFAVSVAHRPAYSAVALALEVVFIQNWVFDAAKRGDVCLWREETLYRFVPGLYEAHGGLRLGPDDVAKVRAHFLSKQAELPAPRQAEKWTLARPAALPPRRLQGEGHS